MSDPIQYVILGGGIAGTTAAEELRKADATASITIIEQETHPLYSRVLLPHYVKGAIPREKVFLKRTEWYYEQRIEWMSGVRATAIDTKNKFITTSEGREIPFDKLLIAIGGEINLAPWDLRGVVYLHTLDDAEQVRELITEVQARPKDDRHAVVYGGGFIALEFINIFAQYGFTQTVVMRGNGFWSRVLSVEAQTVLAEKLAQAGIALVTNEERLTLLGEKELRGVRLGDGKEITAHILGVGIGMHTDYEPFRGSDIAAESGVLTDERCATNVAGVYAAGDVAEFVHPLFGRRVQLGNWLNAQMQGRAAGKVLNGAEEQYSVLTSYTTNLLGLQIACIGDVNKQHATITRHVERPGEIVDLYVRDGRIVGAVLIGAMQDRMAITKAIQEGRVAI